MAEFKKILVVGAGIAGPTMCYWLKKFGFSPTLIEKNSILRQGGHAIDIHGIAVDVIKKMGIYKKTFDMRTQIEQGFHVDAKGNIIHEEQGEKFGYRHGDEIEIARGDLVEILMQSIQDVPCYFNQHIICIKQYNQNVEVTFNDNKTENYDLIIGADGLHSSIRRMVFANQEYDLMDLACYISVFTIPNYLRLNRSEINFEANQKVVSLSVDKNPFIALAAFMFRSNHVLSNQRDEKEQKYFIKRNFIDLGWETNKLLQFMENCDDFYFDTLMQVKMKSWTKGRIALVGDSGYSPSPLSGQGTSLALVGAYLLAGELKAARENHIVAFERYNALLRSFVQANQDLGAWVNETFLLPDNVSKEAVEERTNNILEKLKIASNAITLPEY